MLAANSLAAFHENEPGLSPARKAQLDGLRSDKIYIGRLDVISQHLDGGKRALDNEAQLATALQGLGFSVVEAADYSEEEKAYIFELATVVVIPIGAGMTNLIWVHENARVVFICPPSLTAYQGQNSENTLSQFPSQPDFLGCGSERSLVSTVCDWTRDWFASKFLSHLKMQSTVLRQARRKGGGSGFNGGWELNDVAATVATVQRCMTGTVGKTDCQ